jgi:ELWxxDGT repeat protein
MARKIALLALVSLMGTHLAAADTPHLVKDINAVTTPLSSSPVALGHLGNAVLFQTDLTTRTSSGSALVKSDGTTGGTVTLKTFTKSKPVSPVVTVGTHTFFSVEDAGLGVSDSLQGPQLWVTDGTVDGTRQISSFAPGGIPLQLLGAYGNNLLFARRNENLRYELYLSDGTSVGTAPLGAATGYGSNSNSIDFAIVGTRIYFVADSDDGLYRRELWRSDGTPASTHKVTSVNALDTTVNMYGLRALNDSLAFFSNTPAYGSELTRMDASDAVTVIDLAPGPTSGSYGSRPNAMLNGYIYFPGSTDGTNYELWRSDGTLAGTQLVKDIDGTSSPSFDISLSYIVPAGNRLVFPANDGSGVKLWGTDGTTAGTAALTPVVSFRGDAFNYLDKNGDSEKYEYIPANVGTAQTTIITDGTPGGTAIAPATIDGNYAGILTATGDATNEYISFLTENPNNATQDYRVYKFAPPAQFTALRQTTKPMGRGTFTHLNGKLLFDSFDDASGQELWGSDGSSTQLLVDFRPESTTASSNAQWFTDWNGKLVFVADDGVHGNKLWLSDGTTAGTRLLLDAGAAVSSPSYLYVWNGALYFFAFDGTASHLMRMTAPDATPETLAAASPPNAYVSPSGPEQPQCGFPLPVPLGNKLLFSARTAQAGTELWSTDGTAAGTAMLSDINSNVYYLNSQPMGSQPCNLTVFKNRAYFTAITGAGDLPGTLWSTDGTAAGTTQFSNLSGPSAFITYKNELYFYANDLTGTLGIQTWKTDGTIAGTRPLVAATSVTDKLVGIPMGVSNDKLILLVQSAAPPITYSFWASDGTAAGTVQLAPTTGGFRLLKPDYFYFTNAAGGDEEPWISDGTPAGTHRLADLDSSGSSHPISYLNFNGVTMIVTNEAGGPHLWRTDGTESGTKQVGQLPLDPLLPVFSYRVSGQNLFFVGTESTTGGELYVLANDPPAAVADSANAANGQAVTVNVLSNDADSDGSLDTASVHIAQAPAHGTAAVVANGVTYTPTAGYAGTDTFTYTVADNQGNTSSAATVTLTVTAAASDGGSVTVSSGKKGGGGPLRWYDLLALAALAAWRLVRIGRRNTATWKNLSPLVNNL